MEKSHNTSKSSQAVAEDFKLGKKTRSSDHVVNTQPSKETVPPIPQSVLPKSPGFYGIEDAVKLMRRMPQINVRVLAHIVKECLESTQIRISDIINDADKKEISYEQQIKKLENAIGELETHLISKRTEMENIQNLRIESRKVKNILTMAMENPSTLGPMELAGELGQEPEAVSSSRSLQKVQNDVPSAVRVVLDSVFGEDDRSKNENRKQKHSSVG